MKLMGLLLVFFLVVGLSVVAYQSNPAVPSIFGHTPNEIEGLDTYVRAIASEEIAGVGEVVCPTTPSYTSGQHSEKPKYELLPLDDACTSTGGCIIKQEIYNSDEVVVSRVYEFRQSSVAHTWSSGYDQTGTRVSGDSTQSKVVPDYHSGYIRIRDDGNNAALRNAETLAIYDNSGTYGQNIYFCTASSTTSGVFKAPLVFDLASPDDLVSAACVHDVDIEEYCGDGNGCRVNFFAEHETADIVYAYEGTIFMEPQDWGTSNTPGVAAVHFPHLQRWTGGDASFEWGLYQHFPNTATSVFALLDHKPASTCPGISTSSAYTDPYTVTLYSHPHVRTRVLFYD